MDLKARIQRLEKEAGLTDRRFEGLFPPLKEGTNTCPVCQRKGKFYLKQGRGKCYSPHCSSKGWVMGAPNLLSQIKEIPLHEATSYLEGLLGISNEDYSPILEQALSIYQEVWRESPEAHEAMEKKGLSFSYLSSIGVGYADSYRTLRQYGMKLSDLKKAGLWNEGKRREQYSQRVIFPIRGDFLKGFAARYIGDNDLNPKYKNSTATYPLLILESEVASYDKKRPLFLCEGPTDTLTLHSKGFQSVGTLGLYGILNHGHIFSQFKKMYVVYDADKFPRNHKYLPGEYKSWSATLPQLYELQLRYPKLSLELVFLPEGADVNEVCTDREEWKRMVLDRRINLIDYLIKRDGPYKSKHVDLLRMVAITGRGKEEMRYWINKSDPLEYCLSIFSFV